jgi:hypothetical protein
MSLWIDLATVATGLNLLLLAVIGTVWGRNYRRLRSKHTLGMLVFAVLLFVQNAFTLYFYRVDELLSVWFSGIPSEASTALLLFHLLQTVGIVFLAWVTLD